MDITDYLDQSKVLNREIDRLTYARDASIYRLLPEFAVRPKNENDIKQLFKYAHKSNKSITFRASGTSLSGQTLTNGIIAEIAYNWNKIQVSNNGDSILLEPGVIGEHANQALKKYNRRIGPDPASMKAARIGGIIANNASGMTTGKPCNSYNTMKNIRFIMGNGNIYDTSDANDYGKFLQSEIELVSELGSIRDKIINSEKLKNRIINKYRLKNTVGYTLNAFTDFDEPLDIFAHLLIGSEGTLAFVSNIELMTIEDPPYKSTGLIFFNNINDACDAINDINSTKVQSLELMDHACLRTAKYVQDAPYNIKELPIGTSALLCEFQDFQESKFEFLESTLKNVIKKYNGRLVGKFAREENERLKLWKIRKSLFATVGSMRKPGTSIITEDLCFDIENLNAAINDLHKLFKKWNYEDAVIFGHAKDGNLHFNLSIDLESKTGIENYHSMMEEVVEMTVKKYDGSLKAEHGTGRNMAPYVEYEWGKEIYDIMWRIKIAADPQNILNPGVILNKNKNIHIENLKPMPAVHDTVDLCVECGFCEPVCPSKEFTFTPRNRITVGREISLLKTKNVEISRALSKDHSFNTQLTCAVDGMCEIGCPINIDTGDYVKSLRNEQHGKISLKTARWMADNFKITVFTIGLLIKLLELTSYIFGQKFVQTALSKFNKITKHRVHSWNPKLASIKKQLNKRDLASETTYLYYPSCINRTISADGKGNSLIDIMSEIAQHCGIKLIIPDNVEETCCGTSFSSKGYKQADKVIFKKSINLLYSVSNNGKIPIIVDTSPCTYKFQNPKTKLFDATMNKWNKLKFVDIIPFLKNITEEIDKPPLKKKIVLHPTCSTHKMEHLDVMKKLASNCAEEVIIPQNTSCCGFAGDRGLIIPELSTNAIEKNKQYLSDEEKQYDGYSSSRFCEIGLSTSDQNYVNIALLVREYLLNK